MARYISLFVPRNRDVVEKIGRVFGAVDAVNERVAAQHRANGNLKEGDVLNPGDDDFLAPYAFKKQGPTNIVIIFACDTLRTEHDQAIHDIVRDRRARSGSIGVLEKPTKTWRRFQIAGGEVTDELYEEAVKCIAAECDVPYNAETHAQIWQAERAATKAKLAPTAADLERFTEHKAKKQRLETLPADGTIPDDLCCKNKCGFAGTAEFNGYCSVCSKKTAENNDL